MCLKSVGLMIKYIANKINEDYKNKKSWKIKKESIFYF